MAIAINEEAGIDDELDAMRDLFGEDFPMLAELYLGDSPKRIAALHAAAVSGDANQAARIAHSLGGSCASIGAPALALLCQAVELDCHNGRTGNLVTQAQTIEAAYGKIESRLRVMLQA
jgi:HPt (histidine-containing phosphotransfer) domain-containing protein